MISTVTYLLNQCHLCACFKANTDNTDKNDFHCYLSVFICLISAICVLTSNRTLITQIKKIYSEKYGVSSSRNHR